MSGSPTSSWPRHGVTRWRCWSCRGGFRRRSWRAGSGCRARCRSRAGSRRASVQRLRGAARGHAAAVVGGGGGADRRSGAPVAGRRADSGSPARRSSRRVGRADRGRRQGAVSPSAGALGGLPGGNARATARRRTGRWRRRPTRSSIPTGARGTWPRRRPARTRTSPPSSSGRPAARRRGAVWPPPPRSWSAPRH